MLHIILKNKVNKTLCYCTSSESHCRVAYRRNFFSRLAIHKKLWKNNKKQCTFRLEFFFTVQKACIACYRQTCVIKIVLFLFSGAIPTVYCLRTIAKFGIWKANGKAICFFRNVAPNSENYVRLIMWSKELHASSFLLKPKSIWVVKYAVFGKKTFL